MDSEFQNKQDEKKCARIEMFSDGVFAIAITLLVLDVITASRPESGEPLEDMFNNHWQVFLAFAIGFLTIFVCWLNHHHIFSHVAKCDNRLVWANGFLLMMVSITPFSTAVLAEYISTESSLALAIFGVTFLLMSLVYERVSSYAYKHHLLHEQSDRTYFSRVKLTYRLSIVYCTVALIICFISIPVAIVLYFLLFTVFAFPHQFALRLLKMHTK